MSDIKLTVTQSDAIRLQVSDPSPVRVSLEDERELALKLEQGPEGIQGLTGPSAYEVAVAEGFVGTEAQWLASLVGPAGNDSTVPGPPGESAYELAVANGFVGSEAAWLASLEGDVGPAGPSVWGGISGSISSQADLQSALNAKEAAANKETNFGANTGSDVKFPTVKAVYTWILGVLANYQAALGFTPANNELSNLAGTAINQSLMPGDDGQHDLGGAGQNWNRIKAKTVGFDGGTAIDLDTKKLFDSSEKDSIDFHNRILSDDGALPSIQYHSRALLDPNGLESLNWGARQLNDDGEVLAIDYLDRRLFSSDGATPTLDWSSPDGPTVPSQSPNDNSTKIANTAYVDKILAAFFGAGTNSDLNLSGALTLTQDVFYNTLTISPGAALTLNGYRVFCRTLNVSNAPANSILRRGSNGNSTTTQAGAGLIGALASNSLGGSTNGGAGATGTTGVGAQAGASGAGGNGGASGAGGNGGNGTPNAGGAARAASTATTNIDFNRLAYDFLRGAVLISGGAGAPGGSAGGGDGTNNGRGGGGGASGGGVGAIFAHTIITSASTPASVINCGGGNGGNGANGGAGNVGGGGGGAGAGGGFFYFMFAKKVGPTVVGFFNCAGGNGGLGGNGFGTGTGGRGGGGGQGGRIAIFNVTTATGTTTVGVAGAASAVPSGISGTTGGTGGACSANI